MATSDIALVTKTLVQLLKKRVPKLVTVPGMLDITTKRPELLQSELSTLNLFLYHICEDPTYKNQPIPGQGRRGVARTPMALSLFYVATPQHFVKPGDPDDGVEQTLMGALLKTFHDFPLIDGDLSLDGGATFIMPDALRETGDNWLEIMLRPVTPENALDFWASEQNRTVRLSAYYEVRAIFLEPEKPAAMAGTVLSLGAYVSIKSAHAGQRLVVAGTLYPAPRPGHGAAGDRSPAGAYRPAGYRRRRGGQRGELQHHGPEPAAGPGYAPGRAAAGVRPDRAPEGTDRRPRPQRRQRLGRCFCVQCQRYRHGTGHQLCRCLRHEPDRRSVSGQLYGGPGYPFGPQRVRAGPGPAASLPA